MKRKICVITTARSDYGLLKSILHEIHNDADLELQLVVTGMHLSYEYGYSVDRIVQDGFPIAQRVEILLSSNSRQGMVKSTGLAMISFADSLTQLAPDIVVVLGDRFENFAAASAANLMNIPVAHIHGGELTFGATDDSMRHAITKLSHIHFPVCEVYKNRILQMGEPASHVFNFGAPGLDYLDHFSFLSKEQLNSELGFQFGKPTFLITFHSITRDVENSLEHIQIVIAALDSFQEATLIFTEANADAGGQVINNCIRDYVKHNSQRMFLFKELGLPNYISIAGHADVVIGNSSSGVIEIPCIGKPSINIGSRQDGRIHPDSVIDVELNSASIVDAITQALTAEFRSYAKAVAIPFKQKNTSKRLVNLLKTLNLDSILYKKFSDYSFKIEEVV